MFLSYVFPYSIRLNREINIQETEENNQAVNSKGKLSGKNESTNRK